MKFNLRMMAAQIIHVTGVNLNIMFYVLFFIGECIKIANVAAIKSYGYGLFGDPAGLGWTFCWIYGLVSLLEHGQFQHPLAGIYGSGLM